MQGNLLRANSIWLAGQTIQSNDAVGVAGFEPATSSSRTRRATKLLHIPVKPSLLSRYGLRGVLEPPAGSSSVRGVILFGPPGEHHQLPVRTGCWGWAVHVGLPHPDLSHRPIRDLAVVVHRRCSVGAEHVADQSG